MRLSKIDWFREKPKARQSLKKYFRRRRHQSIFQRSSLIFFSWILETFFAIGHIFSPRYFNKKTTTTTSLSLFPSSFEHFYENFFSSVNVLINWWTDEIGKFWVWRIFFTFTFYLLSENFKLRWVKLDH